MWVWLPEGADGLRSMLRRGTLQETDDSGTQQLFKKARGLASEQMEGVPHVQGFGLSVHAPPGSEGLLLALGGRSDRLIGLAFEHKDHRPKNLPAGGTALYDASGKIWKMVPDKTEFDAGGKPVIITNATDIAIGTGNRFVRIRPGRVDLAVKSPSDQADDKVMTEAGPSGVVFARLD